MQLQAFAHIFPSLKMIVTLRMLVSFDKFKVYLFLSTSWRYVAGS